MRCSSGSWNVAPSAVGSQSSVPRCPGSSLAISHPGSAKAELSRSGGKGRPRQAHVHEKNLFCDQRSPQSFRITLSDLDEIERSVLAVARSRNLSSCCKEPIGTERAFHDSTVMPLRLAGILRIRRHHHAAGLQPKAARLIASSRSFWELLSSTKEQGGQAPVG